MILKLTADERRSLAVASTVTILRPVIWPESGRLPDFSRAFVDEGGTNIWGHGPYLKVPNTNPADASDERVNRVFCPWGYPGRRLRLARSSNRVLLVGVGLVQVKGSWLWELRVDASKFGVGVEQLPAAARHDSLRTPVIAASELAELGLARLPAEVETLLVELSAPPRLAAHLTLVHDVASRLMDALVARFPGLRLPRAEVLFGAATHDIGKAIVPSELSEAGHRHELLGHDLLLDRGFPAELARFAVTHADLGAKAGLADALVALADKTWKGKRDENTEAHVRKLLALELGLAEWAIFDQLDAVIEAIAAEADARLAWQGRFPT